MSQSMSKEGSKSGVFMVMVCALVLMAGRVATAAQNDASPPSDKSGLTLFNPTPPGLMREFNTDRPDVTESPYTVDAGHFQVELSFVEYTYDHDHGRRVDGFSVLPANLKVGLLNNLDLQLVLNPY